MKLFLSKLALFIIIVIIITVSLNNILPTPGDVRYDYRNEFLNEQHGRFNTVFFGSSRTLRHIIPSRFDSLNRINNIQTKSFNLGTPANKSLETYTQFEYFVKKRCADRDTSVKYAFVEIHPLDDLAGNSTSRKGYYWLNFNNINFVFQYYKTTVTKVVDRFKIYVNFLTAFAFRELRVNFNIPVKYEIDQDLLNGKLNDGYISLEDEVAYRKDNERKKELINFQKVFASRHFSLVERMNNAKSEFQDSSKLSPIQVHLNRLKQMLKLAQENHMKLQFIIQPRLSDYKEVLAIENALPNNTVINIGNPDDLPALWDIDKSFDVGHLKSQGARLATSAISQRFLSNLKN